MNIEVESNYMYLNNGRSFSAGEYNTGTETGQGWSNNFIQEEDFIATKNNWKLTCNMIEELF